MTGYLVTTQYDTSPHSRGHKMSKLMIKLNNEGTTVSSITLLEETHVVLVHFQCDPCAIIYWCWLDTDL